MRPDRIWTEGVIPNANQKLNFTSWKMDVGAKPFLQELVHLGIVVERADGGGLKDSDRLKGVRRLIFNTNLILPGLEG